MLHELQQVQRISNQRADALDRAHVRISTLGSACREALEHIRNNIPGRCYSTVQVSIEQDRQSGVLSKLIAALADNQQPKP